MKDRIKLLRKELKLTQAEFGAKVGVKGNTIGNYEMGLRTPSEAVIFSICREFNVNEEWLRDGIDPMFVKSSPYERAYNRFGYIMENSAPSKKAALSMLLELLYSVPDETWDSIMNEYEEIKKED
ncbi:helix-turn-helix transcriptional regulator [Bariatricus sp. SGI.161]|uniref:helix-turn-helix transcriptional regulator n=1 Tax=Bariatricus sp. SGI.161 TaxID=3420550 RepID=UPI003D08E6D3